MRPMRGSKRSRPPATPTRSLSSCSFCVCSSLRHHRIVSLERVETKLERVAETPSETCEDGGLAGGGLRGASVRNSAKLSRWGGGAAPPAVVMRVRYGAQPSRDGRAGGRAGGEAERGRRAPPRRFRFGGPAAVCSSLVACAATPPRGRRRQPCGAARRGSTASAWGPGAATAARGASGRSRSALGPRDAARRVTRRRRRRRVQRRGRGRGRLPRGSAGPFSASTRHALSLASSGLRPTVGVRASRRWRSATGMRHGRDGDHQLADQIVLVEEVVEVRAVVAVVGCRWRRRRRRRRRTSEVRSWSKTAM